MTCMTHYHITCLSSNSKLYVIDVSITDLILLSLVFIFVIVNVLQYEGHDGTENTYKSY